MVEADKKIMDNSSGNKRIAKNTFFLYIRLAVVLIISLYTSRVVLSTLGVVDYGIYNVVAGFVSMFALLSSSLTSSVQRFYNHEIGKNGVDGMKAIFNTSLYIQVLIATIILLFAETVGLWYVNNKLVYPPERYNAVIVVYQSAIASLLFVVLQIPYSSAIIARERINYYAIVSIIDVVLKLIIAITTPLFAGDNLVVYGLLIAGISFLNFLLYFIYSKRSFPQLRLERYFYKEKFVQMLKFSGWNAVLGFSSTIMDQGINILMNSFFGPIVNAARGITFQIKSALLGFVMNITTATRPQLTEAYSSGNIERSKHLMFAASKFLFLSFFVVALPVFYEIDFILKIWLGNNVPDYTSIFVVLILISTLIDILFSPISMIVSAAGDIALFNGVYGILGISLLPVSYIVLKLGAQPEYVFVIGIFFSVIMLISAIVIMQRKTPIRIFEYLRQVLLPLCATVLVTGLLPYIPKLFMVEGFIRLSTTVICSVVFVALIGFYIGLNKTERAFVLSYASKLKVINKIINRS